MVRNFGILLYMTVTPLCPHLLPDCKELYQFLSVFKHANLAKDQTKILSFSLEIPPVDPLVVLGEIARPERLHFYFEKPGEGQAIAALDGAMSFQGEGRSRFYQAQKFIQSGFDKIVQAGDRNLPFAGPHFFCSFTFFDRQISSDSPFPPATVFLPRLQVSRQGDRGCLVFNLAIDKRINIQVLAENLWQEIEYIKSLQATFLYQNNFPGKQFTKHNITSSDRFKYAVTNSLKSIEANQISKLVLAHAIEAVAGNQFNLIHSLNNLRNCYPDCYVFSTSNGTGRNFIGASPERLIKIQNRELVTDALAGSAPRGQTVAEDIEFANRLLNSEKERREHRVVLDFINHQLQELGSIVQRPPLPQILQLSNIQHIWTPIHAQVPAAVQPLEILAQLHPTPAVAGVPRDIACQQIRNYEQFDRSLYAGPLGWIDSQGDSEFVVGIRSALIEGDRARLYAGAGIVAGSDPDKELAEIQLKLQALLNALV
jgi:menaquinone-specific isochorismate synthase